jgi:hypothetical protein
MLENASEQLYYFGNLISWLLSIVGQRFVAPDQVFVWLCLLKAHVCSMMIPTKLRQM